MGEAMNDVDDWRQAGEVTAEAYASAIAALRLGMTQLKPDGRNCVVCGDNDHQAQECLFNPLVMARTAVHREMEWRCFHCGEVSGTEEGARDHFGETDFEIVACGTRSDPDTIAAIVQSVREEEDDEQAETMVRHLTAHQNSGKAP